MGRLPCVSGRKGPGRRLEVVSAAADRVTGHPEVPQDRAGHDHDDGDLGDEAGNGRRMPKMIEEGS
jgi:hypothetical protein